MGYQVWLKASAIPPVATVTSGAPMTASCSSQPLDYCLKLTCEGGNSPYAPGATVWRLADVLNGEPIFVKDGKETENNGALGFHPNFNRGDLLANYCAGQTWGAVVLDKFPEYSFIVGGTFNWGIAGSCTGTESADILEVLRGQRDSITTAFRARTNSYGPAHRDVKIEVVRDVLECGGRFYSDALFSKTETEQCAIMEAVLPKKCTVKYTQHRGMVRQGSWYLADDDSIPTNPGCVRNDDWTAPYCRNGKFPQSLAIGIDRCKVACAARPNCKAIGISHPTRGTSAECFLAGEVNEQDNPLKVYGHWDWYDIEVVCEPGFNPTREPTLSPTQLPTASPSMNPTSTPSANPTKEPSMNPSLNPTATPSSSPTKEPSVSPTLNPTASPSPFPTAEDFIIKIKSFHGKPSDVLDSKKFEGQPNVDIELYNFEEKLTPLEGRRLLRSNEEKSD